MASENLVSVYAKELRERFAPLIQTGRPAALADYPESANCGDQAIWLGEKQLLSELGVTIGGSMITRREDGALVNRFTLTVPGGGTPVAYDKCHRFGPMREVELLGAGAGRVHATVGSVETALSICYDLRFPGMYRASAHEGARLFLVVSAWPRPREMPLRTLAMARAIENQAFLALCNRAGSGADGTMFCGGSCVVSPIGEVLLDLGPDENTGVAEIDVEHVTSSRKMFDVLREEIAAVD